MTALVCLFIYKVFKTSLKVDFCSQSNPASKMLMHVCSLKHSSKVVYNYCYLCITKYPSINMPLFCVVVRSYDI